MLGSEELLAWFQRVRLPECGRPIVRQIRSSDPARRVGGGRRNVSGRYPSRKMEITIQFESHRVELARIYELEHALPTYLSIGTSLLRLNSITKVRSESGWWSAIRLTISLFVRIAPDGKNARPKRISFVGPIRVLIDIAGVTTCGVVPRERTTRDHSV